MPEIDSPSKARSRLASAHIAGPPDPESEEALRCNLALSNLDAAIRKNLHGGRRMHDASLGHLVGLLLMESLIDGATVIRCEAYIRQAVRECRERQDGGGK